MEKGMSAPEPAGRRTAQLLECCGVDVGLLESTRVPIACTVVVPVYNGGAAVGRCLDALRRHTRGARLVVIDDASTDADTIVDLNRRAAAGQIELVRHETNWGYTRTANHALRLGAGGDTVLLNSDTEVGPGWLAGLRTAARSRADVATVSALSDNAGALAMPVARVPNEWPQHLSWAEVARAVGQAPLPFSMEVPTGHGFCMLVTRQAVEQLTGFDEQAFPRGYGEENDFCMRAREAGMINLIAPRVFVRHLRGRSFGAQREELIRAARATVDARHPRYGNDIRAWLTSAEMVKLRKTFNSLREQLAKREHVLPRRMYVLHRSGGGTPATNLDLMTALAAHQESFLLESDRARALELSAVTPTGTEPLLTWVPQRTFRATDTWRQDYAETVAILALNLGIELVHVRHLIDHPLTTLPSLCERLGLPLVISTHDFYLSCPTVHLLDNNEIYCGGTCTPGPGSCRRPTAFVATVPELKHSWIYEWRRRVGTMLGAADAIIATTDSAARTLSTSYPQHAKTIRVIEHGRDLEARFAPLRADGQRRIGPVRIMAVANWAPHKGIDYLRRLAQALTPLVEFHVLGQRSEQFFSDVAITHGPFKRDEQRDLIANIDPDLSALLSIWPETYSHTLTESWALGIPVIATDIGAVAERIRKHGGGVLLPVNDVDAGAALVRSLLADPSALAVLRAQVPRDSIRTRAAMAESYRAVYDRVETAALSPARLGYVVHGALGSHPPTAHVRLLGRLSSPTVRERVTVEQVFGPELIGTDALAGLDALIVQRDALDVDPAKVLSLAHESGVRLIVDVDDDIFHPDAGGRLRGDAERHQARREHLRHLLEGADRVLVSTSVLADRVCPHVRLAPMVVQNELDPRVWLRDIELQPAPQVDEWRILYMGSRTHDEDLMLLRGVMDRLQGMVSRRVVLELAGVTDKPEAGGWTRRLEIPRGSRRFPAFVSWLRSNRLRWHAAVAPLRDTGFNDAKSDLKLLEYAMLELPVVASNVGPYRGSNLAMLTPNEPSCWAEAIAQTLDNHEVARARARAAKDIVLGDRMLTPSGLESWLSVVLGQHDEG
jgi:O-antigen biosynthesis protein